MMNLVAMKVGGRDALVPPDKVKMVIRKGILVDRAISLGGALSVLPLPELIDLSRKIRSLNKRIGPCVQIL